MPSELAKKLAKIGTVDLKGVKRASSTHKPSFLFDSKAASDYDLDTIFSVGSNGFAELRGMDERMSKFEYLFSEASKEMDRVKMTKQEVAQLNKGLDAFLAHLSVYFLTKPAGKVLEWLIRQFNVQRYNVESVIRCVLPYHETREYVKMMDIHRWNFLMTKDMKIAKQSLPRQSLLHACTRKDDPILGFICDMVQKAAREGTGHKTLFSFYAAMLVDLVSSVNITDDLQTLLLPYILSGLEARKIPEYQISTYMILSQVSSRATLRSAVIRKFLRFIVMNANAQYSKHALLCMVHIAQTQEAFDASSFTEDMFEKLLRFPHIDRHLADISDKYRTDRFMEALILTLVTSSASSTPSNDILSTLLHRKSLSTSLVAKLFDHILDVYIQNHRLTSANKDGAAVDDKVRDILATMQERFPNELDGIIQDKMNSMETNNSQDLYNSLTELFRGTRHEPIAEANTTLFLSLYHADGSIRRAGTWKLVDMIKQGGDQLAGEGPNFVQDALLARLHDDVQAIPQYLLDNGEVLAQHIPLDVLKENLSRLQTTRYNENVTAKKLLQFVVELEHQEIASLALDLVLSRVLVFAGSEHVAEIAHECLKRSIVKKNSVLHGLGKAPDFQPNMHYNEQIIRALADHAVNAIRQDKAEVIDYWLHTLGSEWRGLRMLAMLVLRQVLKSLGEMRQVPSTSQVTVGLSLIEKLRESDIAAVDARLSTPLFKDTFNEGDSEKIEKNLSTLIARFLFEEPNSAKTNASISNFVLYTTATAVKGPSDKVAWHSTDSSAYKSFCTQLFRVLATGGNGDRSHIMEKLLEVQLPPDVLEFASSIWVKDDTESSIKVTALEQTHSFLSRIANNPDGKAEDFQMLIPSLVIALMDMDASARSAASRCLVTMFTIQSRLPVTKKRTTKASASAIVACDTFYGSTDYEIKYLIPEDSKRLLDILSNSTEEFVADHTFVTKFFASALTTRNQDTKADVAFKENVLVSFLSHVQAFPAISCKLRLLEALSEVQNPLKLEALAPLLQQARDNVQALSSTDVGSDDIRKLLNSLIDLYTPQAVAMMDSSNREWPLFLDLLSASWTNAEMRLRDREPIQLAALARIKPALFDALSEERQYDLFSVLIHLAATASQGVVKSVKRVLRDIEIDASLVNKRLEELHTELGSLVVPAKSTKRVRRERHVYTWSPEPPSDEMLYTLVALLEMLNYRHVHHDTMMVGPLFETLRKIGDIDWQGQPISVDYLTQLILTVLTGIIRDAEPGLVKEDQLSVDSIVTRIRTTNNPQTHNQALLLMAAIAAIYPEQVIPNTMSLFIFMGDNVLKRDDNYSFQVIQQTLSKIIPPLIAPSTSETNATSSSAIVRQIIETFVGALDHIPEHRRLRLFSVLVQILDENSQAGSDDYLSAVTSMLLEKYSERVIKERKDQKADKTQLKESTAVMQFTLALSNQFDAKQQLHALISLVDELIEIPNEKIISTDGDDIPMLGNTIYNVGHHSNKQIREFKLSCLQFAKQLLGSKVFLSKLLSVTHDLSRMEKEMEGYYRQLSQSMLTLIDNITSFQAEYKKREDRTAAVTTHWSFMSRLAFDILDRVNVLLPLPSFVNVISDLLSNDDATLRKRSLLLFNERLSTMDTLPSGSELDILLGMTTRLSGLLTQKATRGKETAVAVNKQTALMCLSTMVKLFASQHPEPFVNVLLTVIGSSALQNSNPQVQISSLVCLSLLIQHLGPRALSTMPKFMPIVLELCQKAVDESSPSNDDILLQLGALTCLETMACYIPKFVGPLPKILPAALHPSIIGYAGDDQYRRQAQQKAQALLSALAKNVQPGRLLQSVFEYRTTAVSNGKESLAALFSLVGETIASMTRGDMTKEYRRLFDQFFMPSFNSRLSLAGTFSAEDLDELEAALISSFVAMVFKLNETLFKPLYLDIQNWAFYDRSIGGDQLQKRQIFFFKLADSLLDRLKSIFDPYFAYVVDHCASILESYKDRQPDDLWTWLLRSLQKSFLYDDQNIWNKENFEKIYKPLVEQIEVQGEDESEDEYSTRIQNELVPAIGQLAVAVANDELWKPLNYQVLMKTRHDDAIVRLMALKVADEFYSRLGEEWLLFLAESISFFAELMEDDDERVEKLTHEVCKHIETYLGESLEKYFQS